VVSSVKAGSKVTVHNNDGFSHTVSEDNGGFDVNVSGNSDAATSADAFVERDIDVPLRGEEVVVDPESGQPYAASLMDYMLPRANDFPNFQVVECNTPSPFNPLGVKGIGEAGTTGSG